MYLHVDLLATMLGKPVKMLTVYVVDQISTLELNAFNG